MTSPSPWKQSQSPSLTPDSFCLVAEMRKLNLWACMEYPEDPQCASRLDIQPLVCHRASGRVSTLIHSTR
jgi:hypothetical protein